MDFYTILSNKYYFLRFFPVLTNADFTVTRRYPPPFALIFRECDFRIVILTSYG
jgi:hypothetical protein